MYQDSLAAEPLKVYPYYNDGEILLLLCITFWHLAKGHVVPVLPQSLLQSGTEKTVTFDLPNRIVWVTLRDDPLRAQGYIDRGFSRK